MDKVAVVGATGRTGIELVKQLLAADTAVLALVRNPEKAYDVLSDIPRAQRARLEVVKTDLASVETLMAAIRGCKAVVFAACGVSFLGIFSRRSSSSAYRPASLSPSLL
jgi:uncharacterized protein YbjT (DUF2867 family)